MEYVNYHFEPGFAPKNFYQWCEKNKLYRTDVPDNENSRMSLIYNGLEPFVGIDAVVAFSENKPVGIITCEHREIKKENSRENPELEFINLGFINIFVKKSQRKKGIATTLLKEMEALRLGILEDEFKEGSVPYFVAREKAKLLVDTKSLYTYAIGSDIEHRGRQMELDNIAYHKTCQIKNYQPDGYIRLKENVEFENIPLPTYLNCFDTMQLAKKCDTLI